MGKDALITAIIIPTIASAMLVSIPDFLFKMK